MITWSESQENMSRSYFNLKKEIKCCLKENLAYFLIIKFGTFELVHYFTYKLSLP